MSITKRIAGWAGMVGSALFVLIFTLEGWSGSGYDPLSTFISELSIGPRGWIQISNFVLLGILFLVFTRGVASGFTDGKASKAGRWSPALSPWRQLSCSPRRQRQRRYRMPSRRGMD